MGGPVADERVGVGEDLAGAGWREIEVGRVEGQEMERKTRKWREGGRPSDDCGTRGGKGSKIESG